MAQTKLDKKNFGEQCFGMFRQDFGIAFCCRCGSCFVQTDVVCGNTIQEEAEDGFDHSSDCSVNFA